MRTGWMGVGLLAAGWALRATAGPEPAPRPPGPLGWAAASCAVPVPLPDGKWDWGPGCGVFPVDQHTQEHVIGRTSAELTSTMKPTGRTIFSGAVVYPLGFSKTGTFSWLSWAPPCGDACGDDASAAHWSITTIDLKTSTQTRLGTLTDPTGTGEMTALLSKHRQAIKLIVAEHGIDLQPPTILALPTEWKGNRIEVEWRREEEDPESTIWLRKDTGPSREVGRVAVGSCWLCGPHHARLIPFPSGEAAVLIVVYRAQGWETNIPDMHYTILPVSLGTPSPDTPR